MKIHKWIIPVCLILVLSFILGLTGIIDLSSGGAVIKGDRFIGVLITMQEPVKYDDDLPLSDNYCFPAMINENKIESTVTDPEASFTEVDYIFDGISGLKLINPDLAPDGDVHYDTSLADDGISDVSIDISATDDSRTIRLEGTVFYVPQDREQMFWFNRVYQSADSSVYAVRGNPLSGGTDFMDTSVSTTLSEEQHWTEDGKTHSESFSVSISLCSVGEPVTVTLLQYNVSNELIRTDIYSPEDVPETIVLLPGTEYIVVDTENRVFEDYNHSRKICDRKDETVNLLCVRENGILVNVSHLLIWS